MPANNQDMDGEETHLINGAANGNGLSNKAHLEDICKSGSADANVDYSLHPNVGIFPMHVNSKQYRRERARRRFITVEIIVMLFAASFGGLATVKTQYIRHRVSEDLLGNVTHLNSSVSLCLMGNSTTEIENEIQSETSNWSLMLSIANALPSIFSTLLLGTLSEHYGRRLPILCPCVGLLVQCAVSLVVVYRTLPLYVFFAADFFAGLCGGLSLLMAGCFSYVADITNEKQRMISIVVIEILIFVGIGAMQIGLGYMIKELGFGPALFIPLIALHMCVLNAGIPFLLIETAGTKSEGERRTVSKMMGDIVRLFAVKKENRHLVLVSLIVISILIGVPVQGGLAITALYGQGPPFCWESITIGFFITISLFIPGIGTVFGAVIFQRCKLGYLWIVQISIISGLANMLVLAMTFLLQSTVVIFASTFLGLFKLLGLPVIRTFLSTAVEKHEHGALFASLGVVDGLAMFIAPLFTNGIYSSTVHVLSTMVFFVMSCMLIVPIIITGIMQCTGLGKARSERPLTIIHEDDADENQPLINN